MEEAGKAVVEVQHDVDDKHSGETVSSERFALRVMVARLNALVNPDKKMEVEPTPKEQPHE